MLRPSQLLEHPKAVAPVGHPPPPPLLRPLAAGHPEHPGVRLARQEIPLCSQRKFR